ncbi:unnamed protein product [Caenorhabditis bovis]|uniref:Galectin n=1 Tax=Caenorhabditis bovis TaxID=2654633 RepID=A0A8S1F975_9PELO|nr:unnamed protein product [Caenorhabditis bovis]
MKLQSYGNVTFFKTLEFGDSVILSGTTTSAFTFGFFNTRNEYEIWYRNDYSSRVNYTTYNNRTFPATFEIVNLPMMETGETFVLELRYTKMGLRFFKNGIDKSFYALYIVNLNLNKMYVQGVNNCQVHLQCLCRTPKRTKTHLEYCLRLRDFNAKTF